MLVMSPWLFAQELDRLAVGGRDAAVADIELRSGRRDLADDVPVGVELVLGAVRRGERVARTAEERIAWVIRLAGRQVVIAAARLREHGTGRLQRVGDPASACQAGW